MKRPILNFGGGTSQKACCLWCFYCVGGNCHKDHRAIKQVDIDNYCLSFKPSDPEIKIQEENPHEH